MLTTKGLVLRERSLGENDKFLDILTDGAGLLEVLARGVKKQNAKNASVSHSFCYAEYCLSDSGGRYVLNSAEPIRTFYGVGALKLGSPAPDSQFASLSHSKQQRRTPFKVDIRTAASLGNRADTQPYRLLRVS